MTVRYLDHAATTPVRREVLEAMAPYLTGGFGNPSSHHRFGEAAADALDEARARVAAVLGMRRTDVVFTSGATEANNLAIKGIAIAARERAGSTHVVTTTIEHESVRGSVAYLRRIHRMQATVVGVDSEGIVSSAAVGDAVRDDTSVVSVGSANNEVGTVQDIDAIVAAVAGRTFVHVDAVQAAGWLPLDRPAVDAISVAGHKIGAPKGIGALGIRGHVPLEPLLHGGGQERERRSGTENVAGAVALATALELAARERAEASVRVAACRDAIIDGVVRRVPEAALTGHPTRRLPNTASFTFAGLNGEAILWELERRDVIVSSGSACAAGSEEASHVLRAMGTSEDRARTAVRVTLGHGPTPEPGEVVAAIVDAVTAVRRT